MEDLYMLTRKNLLSLSLSALFGIMIIYSQSVNAANGVTLYTPYTNISVPPGESIDYTIDVINNSNIIQNVAISLTGVPETWNYIVKSGGWNIKQLSILPREKKSLSLKVEVPLKVDKGNYRFRVLAGRFNTLPLTINVSEQGTFKTEFTTSQANMQGHAKSKFTYKAALKNRTADKQLYSLRAQAPRGWKVDFKPDNRQATSVEIEANNSKDITIEIDPPDNLKAGAYKMPVSARTSSTSADLELEVVITGSYEMELTTPTGLLSTSITAGNDKRVGLLVKNTGSTELRDVNLSSSAPSGWEVVFEPKKIDKLEAGQNIEVFAELKADKKAIAGDYVTSITARTPEVTSKVSLRVSVKTPMFWGWVGILVITIAAGSIYYLFRKFGRR